MIQKAKFLIFERSYLIRQGLRSIIQGLNRCEILEEFTDMSQLSISVKNHKPNIILINTELANLVSDIELKNIKKEYRLKLIDINNSKTSIYKEHMDATIHIYEEKQTIINLLTDFTSEFIKERELKKQDNELSEREKEIVALAAKGFTNKEIAVKLFISIHTVITHRKNISRKLGIKSVSGLTVYAILNRLTDMKEL